MQEAACLLSSQKDSRELHFPVTASRDGRRRGSPAMQASLVLR